MTRGSRLFFNGSVYQGHAGQSGAADGVWAEALAVEQGRVVFCGPLAEAEQRLAALRAGTSLPVPERVDLQGRFLIPGFIDGHMHPLWGAVFQEDGLKLVDASGAFLDSRAEIGERVRLALAEGPESEQWLVGYGWTPALARESGFDRCWLDQVSPRRPVYLLSLDAHFAIVNSAGLERLGTIVYPDGSGHIPAGEDGRPSGLLLETPQFIASMRVLGQMPFEQRARAFERFQAQAVACGITTVCDIVADRAALDFYLDMWRQRRLRLRVFVAPYGPLNEAASLREQLARVPEAREQVCLGPLKFLLDGTPGNHNAAWFQAYSDDPSTSGFLTIAPDALTAEVMRAEREGYDLALHAAGDLSVHLALDAIESGTAWAPRAAESPCRHRIEHFDNVTDSDRKRLVGLAGRGLVASVQPTHFAEVYLQTIRRVIGAERLRREYPLATFVRAGVPLAINTDWPAALSFDPRENLTLALEHGEESLSPEQALEAATWGNAYALHAEMWLGSFAPGCRADAVLLDRDPLSHPPVEWQISSVLQDGEVVEGSLGEGVD